MGDTLGGAQGTGRGAVKRVGCVCVCVSSSPHCHWRHGHCRLRPWMAKASLTFSLPPMDLDHRQMTLWLTGGPNTRPCWAAAADPEQLMARAGGLGPGKEVGATHCPQKAGLSASPKTGCSECPSVPRGMVAWRDEGATAPPAATEGGHSLKTEELQGCWAREGQLAAYTQARGTWGSVGPPL